MTGNKDNPNSDTPEQEELKQEVDNADHSSTDVEPKKDDEAMDERTETSTDSSEEAEAPAEITNQDASDSVESSKAATQKLAAKKSGNKGFWFLLILILLLIIGLGIGAYYGWQTYQEQLLRVEALEGHATEQRDASDALSRELAEQQAQWSSQQQEQFAALQEAQTVLQQRLDSHSTRIQGLAGTSRQDWLLAEVRYLLRLANQRLLVEQNTLGAQGLLESADKILVSIDDNGLLPVRDAVAKELIALKIANTVDKEGLYLRISALKAQIQALPLIPFINTPEDTPEVITEDDSNNAEQPWYKKILSNIQSSLANIGDLIQIRQHDTAPELLLSEQQQYQVVNHLTLLLEQAQYGLLHEKKGIYRDSLTNAENTWSTYYSHYNEYEVIQGEISNLKQQAITQTLPDISRSSRLITEYIEQFHQTDRQATAVNKPEENKEESN